MLQFQADHNSSIFHLAIADNDYHSFSEPNVCKENFVGPQIYQHFYCIVEILDLKLNVLSMKADSVSRSIFQDS